jgi:hypothetical protein
MVNIKAVRQLRPDLNDDERRIWEEEERAMRDLLASLPPPPPLEELARQQGVRIPQRWEDLTPDWSESEWDGEEDFDTIREQMRASEIEVMRRKLAETPPTGLNPADDYETFEREHWANQIAAWEREHANASDKDTKA